MLLQAKNSRATSINTKVSNDTLVQLFVFPSSVVIALCHLLHVDRASAAMVSSPAFGRIAGLFGVRQKKQGGFDGR
jgi:hypothetical protein